MGRRVTIALSIAVGGILGIGLALPVLLHSEETAVRIARTQSLEGLGSMARLLAAHLSNGAFSDPVLAALQSAIDDNIHGFSMPDGETIRYEVAPSETSLQPNSGTRPWLIRERRAMGRADCLAFFLDGRVGELSIH